MYFIKIIDKKNEGHSCAQQNYEKYPAQFTNKRNNVILVQEDDSSCYKIHHTEQEIVTKPKVISNILVLEEVMRTTYVKEYCHNERKTCEGFLVQYKAKEWKQQVKKENYAEKPTNSYNCQIIVL